METNIDFTRLAEARAAATAEEGRASEIMERLRSARRRRAAAEDRLRQDMEPAETVAAAHEIAAAREAEAAALAALETLPPAGSAREKYEALSRELRESYGRAVAARWREAVAEIARCAPPLAQALTAAEALREEVRITGDRWGWNGFGLVKPLPRVHATLCEPARINPASLEGWLREQQELGWLDTPPAEQRRRTLAALARR